jgi:hypothetical protein
LGILLLVLALCIGALVYDYKVARPGSEAANAKIQSFVQQRNQMSVKEAGPVTSVDIQKELGRSPTWIEKEPTYTVEWYCWWGKTPLLSTRRHYITVLYVGDDRRFSAQQLNGPPAEDDLPTHFMVNHGPSDVAPLETPQGAAPSGGTPAGAPPGIAPGMPTGTPPGMPPGMGGKGKGKKGKGKGGAGAPTLTPPATDPGATLPPTTETTPEPSATEKEKPASADDKPAASAEKPAEPDPKPSAEKPSAEKPNDKPAADAPPAAAEKPADAP